MRNIAVKIKYRPLVVIAAIGMVSLCAFVWWIFKGKQLPTNNAPGKDSMAVSASELRFAELQKEVDSFNKKPFLPGSLVDKGVSYNFKYRYFDKPLNLVIPYSCPYVLDCSPLRSELSAHSLWHYKDIRSPEVLNKWRESFLPSSQKEFDKDMDLFNKNNPGVCRFDYFAHLKMNEILGEVVYKDKTVVVFRYGNKKGRISAAHYVKDDSGRYLKDINDYRNNVLLCRLSQDKYSVITSHFGPCD